MHRHHVFMLADYNTTELFGLRLSLSKIATSKVRQVWLTWMDVWFKPHLRQVTLRHTSHTLKKYGKILLDMPTYGSHFEKLTLDKCGNIVWQNVAWIDLKPNRPYVCEKVLDRERLFIPLQVSNAKCMMRHVMARDACSKLRAWATRGHLRHCRVQTHVSDSQTVALRACWRNALEHFIWTLQPSNFSKWLITDWLTHSRNKV